MMRVLLILALLLATGAAQVQSRAQSIEPDRIEDVRLDDEGRATLRFRTEHIGRLRADIFSTPDTAGQITVSFRDPNAAPTSGKTAVRSPIWDAGRYEADVQAANPGSAIVQLRVSVDIPLDEFEPNDTRETAARVEIPFEGVIRISNGDPDWFRVDPPTGGVLGIHLHRYNPQQLDGPRFRVFEGDGTLLLESAEAFWGYRGMRYVRATGRPLYIEASAPNNFGENDVDAFMGLEIVLYRPEGAPASARSLVTLSLEGEDPSMFQLDLVGEAIGVDTVAANEAGGVARELDTAIRGRKVNWGIAIAGLLALLVLGGGGYFVWRRTRANVKAPRTETEPASEE